ncbi:MAG: efflux RND transporter periplasmic adaptor subunit [Marinifilaceae bacterium]
MKLLISILCAGILLSACGDHHKHKEAKHYSLKGKTIIVEANSSLIQKIKTETVKTAEFSDKLTTAGIVKAIPNKYAQIAAPFAGRITRSFVHLGQHVKKNEAIFEINSPDFFEASKVYYQAKQEMELAKKSLKRQQDLSANGVGVQKDLEEIELDYDNKVRDFKNATLSLKVFQVDTKNLVLGQALIVRSPIEGDIIDNNLVIGQYLKGDEAPVALVAELNKVWVVGQVKEKYINRISNESNVEITLSASVDKCIKAKIFHISEVLDEETRSVEVFIECNNYDRIMKPGMYASVKFIHSPKSEVLIPSSAVLQMEENNYVFVKIGKDSYERRTVKTRTTSTNQLIVISGLKKDETVVTEGSYYLMEAK